MKPRPLEAHIHSEQIRQRASPGQEVARVHLSQQGQGRHQRSGAKSTMVRRIPDAVKTHHADCATRTACVYCRRSVSQYFHLSKLCDDWFAGEARICVVQIVGGLTANILGYTAYDLRCGTTSSPIRLYRSHIFQEEQLTIVRLTLTIGTPLYTMY